MRYGWTRAVPGTKQYGILAAIDSRTNRIAWQRRMPHQLGFGGGSMTTAGNLVFHGEPDGNIQAYDAKTGDLIWQFQTGFGADSPVMTYEIDAKIVTEPTGSSPDAPGLSWKNSINVAHASSAAYHDSTRRLYVLTDDPQGFVYQLSTDNYALLSSHALGRHGLALTVSNDGSRVYIVAEGANAGDPRQLHVLDATQAGLPLVQANPLDIPNSSNGAVLLAANG